MTRIKQLRHAIEAIILAMTLAACAHVNPYEQAVRDSMQRRCQENPEASVGGRNVCDLARNYQRRPTWQDQRYEGPPAVNCYTNGAGTYCY